MIRTIPCLIRLPSWASVSRIGQGVTLVPPWPPWKMSSWLSKRASGVDPTRHGRAVLVQRVRALALLAEIGQLSTCAKNRKRQASWRAAGGGGGGGSSESAIAGKMSHEQPAAFIKCSRFNLSQGTCPYYKLAPNSSALVNAVASNCNDGLVVVNRAGPRVFDPRPRAQT